LLLFPAEVWAQDKTALESEPAAWVDVLPDESLKGWTRVPIPPDRALNPITQWSVDTAQRFVVCEGNRAHEWLRYDRELANFIFHVEWRFTKLEGGKGYNSGVFVRNSYDGVIWHQAQVGGGNGGYLFGDTLVNGLRQRINLRPQMKENRVKEAGEWNTYELRCEGRTITLFVNGGLTSQFTNCEVPKGYLGLEAEGYRIEFRTVKLKRLP
jgi:hypothetical protein